MWNLAIPLLITAAICAAIAWHCRGWRKKHAKDPLPPVPMIDGVSAFTGDLIASGQPNTELGDGAPLDRGGTVWP